MNFERKKEFSTVGGLISILKEYPEDTQVYVCGEDGRINFSSNESFVVLESVPFEVEYPVQYEHLMATSKEIHLRAASAAAFPVLRRCRFL